MYIVILGEVINFKEIVYDEQKLKALADKNWEIKQYVNSAYKDFICSNFSSAHADYIEGVLLCSEESFELSKKIAKEIIDYIAPFQINIAIAKGELYILNKVKADWSNGPAFWEAGKLLGEIKKSGNKESQILIADSIESVDKVQVNK
jgi:hypothetical protein